MSNEDLPYLVARIDALEALVVALLAGRLVSDGTLSEHAAIEQLAQRKLAMDALADRTGSVARDMASGYVSTMDDGAVTLARSALAKLG